MEHVYVSFCDSAFGLWRLEADESGLRSVTLASCVCDVEQNQITRQAKEELEEYLYGTRSDFSVPLSLQGSPFQMTVWQALREIPYGKTWSYSDVAAKIGRPEAVRAVARAIGRNPCLIVVPCHRVVGKSGNLTGFSAGLAIKEKLLRLEAVLP